MLTLNANIRKDQGKGSSRRLRLIDKCPAVVYGKNIPSISIELNQNEILNIQSKKEFYRDNLLLVIDGKDITVKIKKIQRHVYKLKIIHIDFLVILNNLLK